MKTTDDLCRKEQIQQLIKQSETKEERQDILNKVVEKYPNITIKEMTDMGFPYEEIVFG